MGASVKCVSVKWVPVLCVYLSSGYLCCVCTCIMGASVECEPV